jgi:hypothetical protein
MSSCAFHDCGRPDCLVCAPARVRRGYGEPRPPADRPRATDPPFGTGTLGDLLDPPPVETSASLVDARREDAPAIPQAARKPPAWMPKKRHRVGPHR